MVRELETKIVFSTDESQKNKAIKAYQSLQKAQKGFVKEQAKAGTSTKAVAKGIDVFNKELREQAKILDALDDKWRQNVDGAETLEDQIKRLNDTFDETSNKVGSFGDIQSNLGASGALLGAAGLGGAESALTLGGEGAALLEELPRLKDAFKAAGPAVQVTAKALGLTELASTGASLGLGATAASLFAIAVPLALVSAAIGGVLIAVNQFNAAAEKQKEVLLAQIDAQRAVSEAIGEGLTSEDAEARLEELKAQRASEVVLLEQQTDAYGSLTDQLGALTGIVQVFDGREQALADSIDEASGNIAAMDAEIRTLENAVDGGALAANDAAQSEANLTAERETAVQEADRLAATVAQFEEKRASAAENAAIAQGNALENEKLNSKFAREDQIAQEKDHQSRLTDIASEGRSNIEKISAELTDLPAERLEALGEVEADGNVKLEKARSSFFDKSQSNLKKFQRASAKVETETSKKRIRLLEDVQDQLDDAQRGNDVIAFLRIQRESEKQITRGIIDEEAAEQERIQRFIEGQQQEREAFAAKQAEIQLAIQAERIAVNESFLERREQLTETLELERTAIEERKAAEIARFNEQEAREAQTAERAQRRQELRERQQETAAQRRAQELNIQQQAAEQAHARELAKIAEIDRAIQSIQPPPAATGSRGGGRLAGRSASGGLASSRLPQRRPNSGTMGRLTPFHNGGGVAFSGGQQEGFIFARSGEIVLDPEKVGTPVPFPNTQGSGTSVGAGNGVTFAPTIQISSVVGDIASIADVNRANEAMAMELGNTLVPMIESLVVA